MLAFRNRAVLTGVEKSREKDRGREEPMNEGMMKAKREESRSHEQQMSARTFRMNLR